MWKRRVPFLLMSMLLAMLGTLAFSLPVNTARAEIYKWTDDRGNVHYSDEKPEDRSTETVTPNTEKMGVELTQPATAQEWKQQVLGGPASPADTSVPASTASAPATTAPQSAAGIDTNRVDICESVVGLCFTPEQDYVCKLRYGTHCWDVYYWKVCRLQDCEDRHLVDKCDSPFYFLDNRPVMLGRRDVGRPLPLRESVSAQDWACLSQHGFFCDELANETLCRQEYNQSCAEMKNWVEAARKRCNDNRDGDCKDIDVLVRYRPAPLEEVKKSGVRNAAGGVTRYDLLFQSMDVTHNDANGNARLRPVLESITGLNIDPKRKWYDCDQQRHSIINHN